LPRGAAGSDAQFRVLAGTHVADGRIKNSTNHALPLHSVPFSLRLAAVLTLGALAARATITLSTDTATLLTGTFTETGLAFESSSPVAFLSLPGGVSTLYVQHLGLDDTFRTLGAGTPENPSYHVNGDPGPNTLSGTYSNGGIGLDQVVNWTFSDFQDDGSVFTGSFSFAVAAVPEPAESVVAAGLGLAAIALLRRGGRALRQMS